MPRTKEKECEGEGERKRKREEKRKGEKSPTLKIGRSHSKGKERSDKVEETPGDIWAIEKSCLLMILEARTILREIVEEEIIKTYDENLNMLEMKRLLEKNKDHEQSTNTIETMQDLRKRILAQMNLIHNLEKESDTIEKKIALIISNQASIHDVLPPKKKKKEDDLSTSENFSDFRRMEKYGNLFFLLQNNPRYLTQLIQLVPQKHMSKVSEIIVFYIFGDGFSSREEYLLLDFFKSAFKQVIEKLKFPEDLLQVESVIPKMVLVYNKRNQGINYLKQVLSKPFSKLKEMNNIEDPLAIVDIFLDSIMNSIEQIPYGLRLICFQIDKYLSQKFRTISQQEIMRVLSFFCYFKFLNPAIVNPNEFQIDYQEMDLGSTKYLIRIALILQYLFEFRQFPASNPLSSVNEWISKNQLRVHKFYRELIGVPSPKVYLQFDKYSLYAALDPIIFIKLRDIVFVHQLVFHNLNAIVTGERDPLWMVMAELGDYFPEIPDEDSTTIQLILKNKISHWDVKENPSQNEILYQSAIEMIITILNTTPIQEIPLKTLPVFLQLMMERAIKRNDKNLKETISKAIEVIARLEKSNLITKSDNYSSFISSIASEVLNRSQRRLDQSKEIEKLRAKHTQLQKRAGELKAKISDFDTYLEDCRENLYRRQFTSKPSNNLTIQKTNTNLHKKHLQPDLQVGKTIKFTYKDLVKFGVIEDSDIPELSRVKMKFLISMKILGQFLIEVKLGDVLMRKMQLDFEDLLEMKDCNEQLLELDHITLNVLHTLNLINHHFFK
eukprot:TRINITY_DN6740_c0_g1_i1.p1 TRINITY_DN6740_c0_g1~~TRINITY_DN6740_c0_g1_i1.p1  ORF type:complete len:781 (-),score=247.39 TRINITY_DN6740_c0_g1_i1:24-2366(-)